MADFPRSPQARDRAEQALVWLLHELGDEQPFIVVLGGLVPETLTSGGPTAVPQHLGTTDVDLLLITHVEPDGNLSSVERALSSLDFAPDPHEDGWRWKGGVDGHPVLTSATVAVRFAGLEGYLISKCVTVRTRSAAKDYYDLAYVLLYNRAGGPEQTARRLREGTLADATRQLRTTFLEVRERYRRPTDDGPRFYAEQALLVDPDADEPLLRADAVDASARFFAALEDA